MSPLPPQPLADGERVLANPGLLPDAMSLKPKNLGAVWRPSHPWLACGIRGATWERRDFVTAYVGKCGESPQRESLDLSGSLHGTRGIREA